MKSEKVQFPPFCVVGHMIIHFCTVCTVCGDISQVSTRAQRLQIASKHELDGRSIASLGPPGHTFKNAKAEFGQVPPVGNRQKYLVFQTRQTQTTDHQRR